MKLRDAEQLATELDGLLREIKSDGLTAEHVGKLRTWKHGVDFILLEVSEAGWNSGRSDSATAMGQVHSSLQSMKLACDHREQAARATSSAEREFHFSIHANQLKLMRENLRYAHEWIERESY
jgi:hypothetical protein